MFSICVQMNKDRFFAVLNWLLAPIGAFLWGAVAFAQSADVPSKPASRATMVAQTRATAALPKDYGRDLDFAQRGFVGTRKDPIIRDAQGKPLWALDSYAWVKGASPATVNPSLWRHMTVLNKHGLFKLGDGMWQVRGFDVSNMTVIAGKTGWIVIDPLTRKEIAAAALALVTEKLGARPIVAIIYTHSHSDHFGGVKGLVSADDVKSGKVAIIAPEHFIEEAASENVIAGPAMGRRAGYQFGVGLKPGPQGQMGSGIGMGLAGGEITLIPPTDLVRKTGETRVLDGVTFLFQMVPESEAPAELNVMIPERRTLVIGEIATCSQHNILTPRGALVRNASKWAGYLTEALRLYADESDTVASSHCWPHFGKSEVRSYLTAQRDNYKFLHDQSVRLMNKGETAPELAEAITPPASLAKEWFTRGYYGTYNHNSKAVYQRYLGWYDANPANLNPHIPTERAKRMVEAIGGTDRVLGLARKAMEDGDYRWSSDLLNQLVFAVPDQAEAKALLADTYEQLAYQAESALWRNMYLSGANELRNGVSKSDLGVSADLVAAIPTAMMLDSVATRIDPALIADQRLSLNFNFTDRNEKAAISTGNAVMVSEMGEAHAQPQATLSGPRALFFGLLYQKVPLAALEKAGLKIDGDRHAVEALQSSIEIPSPLFNIVSP
jgi:alkyl sulfatase BDS1-like metallo-beta-lactamase superfamily hydrolase